MSSADRPSRTAGTDEAWPAWSIEADPGALTGYVLPDVVGPLLPEVPGPSSESALTRARRVYELIAVRGVGYAFEEAFARDGAQLIRSPQEVLWAPRHATCLDLALVYAGGLLKAGLDAAIILVDPAVADQPRHAVVAVPMSARLDDLWRTEGGASVVWLTPPEGFLDMVAPSLDADVLLIDPNGLGQDLGTSRTVGLAASFDDAAARGARYLADGARWAWRIGIPMSRQHAGRFRPPDAPVTEPLRAPYRGADEAPSPLQVLRPEYQLVPFQHRHELTVLRDWCAEVKAGHFTGLVVLHSVGGAGKTRLALELAQRLRVQGWYAGTLPKGGDGTAWLAQVISPLLVIVDYADGRVGTNEHPGDARRLLKALRERRGPPAVVVLTARSIDGQWLEDLTTALEDDRHDYRTEILALPEAHPHPGDVYRRTFQRLTPPATPVPGLPPPITGTRWTTLDLVLLGWLAAKDRGDVRPQTEDDLDDRPHTKADLYEKALRHEVTYWCTVHEDLRPHIKPERKLLRTAAACVSLVTTTEDDSDAVLCAIRILREDPTERSVVRRTLATCLSQGTHEGLAVRPDPIGDHMVLHDLRSAPAVLEAVVVAGGPQGLVQAVTTLTRAGQQDRPVATDLIAGLVEADRARWPQVLDVAAAQGGAALTALERLAARPGTPLPLDELSDRLPFTTLALFDLALIADRRRVEAARAVAATGQDLAELLVRLSERCHNAGDQACALASITEAVGIYRRLADPQTGNPAAHLPNLATALNNLSLRQAEAGDREAALATITEAVGIYQQLADPQTGNPAAHLPNLAGALDNLSLRQAEAGDREAALATITEAVGIYQQLADPQTGNPAAYLPNLAGALNNLSIRKAEAGDREAALATSTEAVGIYQQLADPQTGNPAAHLPNLAGALNNLSNCQAEAGDREAALATSTEAVGIYQRLAAANPAVYLPVLAGALNNLSNWQAEAGDREAALATGTEAVGIYQRLADPQTGNPAAHLPNLATALNNLSGRQAEAGDREAALATSTEAVGIYQRLAAANPAAYLPVLAGALNNLSNWQAEAGDWEAALATSTEAVGIYQRLADPQTGNPAAYLPNLATALNNLSLRQAKAGDWEAALATSTEAVGIRRRLADPQTGNPAAYLPGLAMSLNNLSLRQAEAGDWEAALATGTEAVGIYRWLADPQTGNPAAYLPDLSGALNNLSGRQAEAGDWEAALATSTEAVGIYRWLADPQTGSPAAHLPNLAGALNNLSNCQAEAGDWEAALAAITEAVGIRRRLADPQTGNPAAYLPDLAGSLNNLSLRQAEAGDREAALAAITEAVGIRRRLADPQTGNPAAYLPDLAGALNNLSLRQAEAGDREAALAAITEAVGIYRWLADPQTGSPAAYLPDLAGALNNLSLRQAEAGDREAALAAITEAVGIRRRLVDPQTGNPAAYLPDLATALSNLSVRQAEAGDREAALAAITEAVGIRRRLAAANPATYLPNLATALNNLADRQYDAGCSETRGRAWEEAIAVLPYAAARAELRAAWVARLAYEGDLEHARSQVIRAVAEVDAPTDDATDDRNVAVVRGRTRRTIRAIIHSVLPAWATAPITDQHLALADAAGAAVDWPQLRTAIEQHTDLLLSSDFRVALQALTDLHPEHPGPGVLLALLSQVDQIGLPTTIDRQQAFHDRRALAEAWIETPTWADSLAFHRQHESELATSEIRELLAALDTGVAHRHVAILDLAAGPRSLEEVYALITDPGTAESTALDAIDHGHLDVLRALVAASPALHIHELTLALINAVLALADGQSDRARAIADQIVNHAEPTQRRAYAVHLGNLHRHAPEMQELSTVIEVLARG